MPSEKRPSKPRTPRTNQAPDERSAKPTKATGKPYAPKTDRPASDDWSKPKPMRRGAESFGNKPRPSAGGKPTGKFGDARKPYGKPDGPAGDRPFGDRPPRAEKPKKVGKRESGYGKEVKRDYDPTRKPYGKPDGPAGDRPYSDRPRGGAGDRPYGDKPRGSASGQSPKRDGAGYGKDYRGATNSPKGRFSKDKDSGSERRPYDKPRGRAGENPYPPRENSGAGERIRRSSAPKRGPKGREERDPNELSEGAKSFVKFIKEKPPREEPLPERFEHKPQEPRVGGKGPKRPAEAETKTDADGVRLNKYLSNAGVAARRKADELIAAGHVLVNGVVVKEMGHRVMKGDKVTFQGKNVEPMRNLVYILLNKPKDFVTTTDDEKGRRTVMELVANATEERIYPVGRLDRATTGLLLFTNDGELAQRLTHPSHGVRKVYAVTLDKPLHPQDLTAIKKGLTLEDGLVQVDDVAYGNEADKKEIGVEIHVGKNRIVRRIFEHLGYDVVKLDRVMYAGLNKKDLPRGRWKHLDEREIIMLKHFKG
ncbi:pseudouridine synthase [soil metagenome]